MRIKEAGAAPISKIHHNLMSENNNNNSCDDDYDEGYPSPDDDISVEGTKRRGEIRLARRIKRKKLLEAQQRINSSSMEQQQSLWADMVQKHFDTSDKIAVALMSSQIPKPTMERWLMMVSKEVSEMAKADKKATGGEEGEFDPMPLDFFNALLDPKYPKFTEETYVIDKASLEDKKSYITKQNPLGAQFFTIRLKREREAKLCEKWEEFRIAKIDEAAKKGRISDKRSFAALNRSYFTPPHTFFALLYVIITAAGAYVRSAALRWMKFGRCTRRRGVC